MVLDPKSRIFTSIFQLLEYFEEKSTQKFEQIFKKIFPTPPPPLLSTKKGAPTISFALNFIFLTAALCQFGFF